MQRKAYAKINIGLRVLFKRNDGYHELETVFHRVNVFDTLTFEPHSELVFHSSDSSLPSDESNLCLKAGLLLKEKYQVEQGAKITLEKRIPIGAGLGGGSSDAASTLLGLNKLWSLYLSAEELAPLAMALGSDVPYFLKRDSAYATGRGEKLTYFHLDVPYWIVVVYPNIHVSTVWAYKRFHITEPKMVSAYYETLGVDLVDTSKTLAITQNDFEDIIFPEYPVIAKVKEDLQKFGALFTQMSGSGSSVYGSFADEQLARIAVEKFGKEYRVFLTEPSFNADC